MEKQIYDLLRHHKIPLKKREELTAGLLKIFKAQYDKEDMSAAFEAGKGLESFEEWIKEYDADI